MAALALFFCNLFSFRAFFVGLCKVVHSSSVSFGSVAVGEGMIGVGLGSLGCRVTGGGIVVWGVLAGWGEFLCCVFRAFGEGSVDRRWNGLGEAKLGVGGAVAVSCCFLCDLA
jgi:hypothetical protein